MAIFISSFVSLFQNIQNSENPSWLAFLSTLRNRKHSCALNLIVCWLLPKPFKSKCEQLLTDLPAWHICDIWDLISDLDVIFVRSKVWCQIWTNWTRKLLETLRWRLYHFSFLLWGVFTFQCVSSGMCCLFVCCWSIVHYWWWCNWTECFETFSSVRKEESGAV